jgi:hypothetical protein
MVFAKPAYTWSPTTSQSTTKRAPGEFDSFLTGATVFELGRLGAFKRVEYLSFVR